MDRTSSRRVVITGTGVISPLGNSREKLWAGLSQGQSGIAELTRIPADAFPTRFGGECREFTGAIEEFGPLEKDLKRAIRKGMNVMCREIAMGVAAAQLALTDARIAAGSFDPDRTGCVYGCDHLSTVPEEYLDGVRNCTDAAGDFHFEMWGEKGLTKVEPLWLLRYLPNMPASHIAIYNDLRGPNNSLTLREAASNAAVTEAYLTIVRGHADVMLAGATGSRIHPHKSLQAALRGELARGDDPAKLVRPFDRQRTGSALGEGAAALVLEDSERAKQRGATILGEIIGYGSSTVLDRKGAPGYRLAVANTLRRALQTSGLQATEIGHIHAHGLGTREADRAEAQAIAEVLGDRVPVVAAKSNFGNLSSGSGLVELIGSLAALSERKLFPVLNYETPDPDCPVNAVRSSDVAAGDTFMNVNFSPQGQATAVVVRRYVD